MKLSISDTVVLFLTFIITVLGLCHLRIASLRFFRALTFVGTTFVYLEANSEIKQTLHHTCHNDDTACAREQIQHLSLNSGFKAFEAGVFGHAIVHI